MISYIRDYSSIILFIVSCVILLVFTLLINKVEYIFLVALISGSLYIICSLRFKFLNKLQESKEQYYQLYKEQEMILDNIETQVWYLKDRDLYGRVNQAHADFLGEEKEEIAGKKIQELFSSAEAKKYIADNKQIFNSQQQTEFDYWIENAQGEERLLLVNKIPKLDYNNRVQYLICTAKDITRQEEAKEEIEYLNYHDSLTGLYNRRYFEKKLQELDTKNSLPVSIIVGDINGLKLTNDAFGHHLGDQLLKEAAQVIEDSCRKEDIIARWGGDEFVILLPETGKQATKKICSRIKQNCEQQEIDSLQLEISISLGYAAKREVTTKLEKVFKQAEDWMYKRKLTESKSFHNSVISSLKKTLKEKTNETVEHSKRLKKLALAIGEKLGLAEAKLDDLSLLAELHDLGKVGVTEEIINKAGALTEEEWVEMKKHSEIGSQIAKSSPELSDISEGILSHHEWWDGTGYPQGLQGEEIPLIARIISIVDAYDVMVTSRPYDQAISKEEALREIKAGAGSQFDPTLVDVFVTVVNSIREGL